ncbi:energy-coupling factor transporter transmembrane protein EcfT [Rhodococcus rhodnii]|uniref:Energy-coupling factor transporter transmembrane protein EcfT n=2 Tax=Rhodococcus rhodnii TaxID=38312 RepID=R7WP52_9NOCA|nr:energy-coupling factor transporter transmembrane component T [Rhodococcus rhodnii]EOM77092.1 hypothetical protein Rrhod_1559 [Rhodococcus rhodnii LMG 5362]TXG90897.1 energy-coupling factor transporter transmembrane protein EcfT [Rhodococcus rhodnii]
MSTLGVHRPGDSLLHRAVPGVKLIALVVAVVAVTLLVRRPVDLVVPAVLVVAAFAVARIPFGVAMRQLRPVVWMLLVVGVFQIVFTGLARAIVVCGVILVAVALAALVSLTTRLSDMLDTIVRWLRPLRRIGVDPERAGLVLAMTVRAIPLVADIVRQVNEARRARGLGFSLRALVVPVVVGTLTTADAMGDALAARGLDD